MTRHTAPTRLVLWLPAYETPAALVEEVDCILDQYGGRLFDGFELAAQLV
jgi:hypothetical protein